MVAVTCKENFVKFGHVVFELRKSTAYRQMVIQTYKHAA